MHEITTIRFHFHFHFQFFLETMKKETLAISFPFHRSLRRNLQINLLTENANHFKSLQNFTSNVELNLFCYICFCKLLFVSFLSFLWKIFVHGNIWRNLFESFQAVFRQTLDISVLYEDCWGKIYSQNTAVTYRWHLLKFSTLRF